MKKALIVLLAVLLAACAFGCIRTTGKYRTTMCVSSQTDSGFSMDYEYFDGHKTYTFNAPEGTVLNVRFATDGGELSCVITDKKGKEYYRNEAVETGETTVELGQKGEYSVALVANGHSGAFYFSW